MAGCRKAAERLMPRLGAVLEGPEWESQMFKAVADELKRAGVYPNSPPAPGPGCAVSAGQEAGATPVATLPGIGPIIAAVLAVVAAVIVLIGQLVAKGKEDEAASKAKEDQAAKISKLRRRVSDETARRDDCLLFGKKPD